VLPEAIIKSLLRQSSSTLVKAAYSRLATPLARLHNAHLNELVLDKLGQRELSDVEGINSFLQEIAVEIGYLPIDWAHARQSPMRRAALIATERYREYCANQSRVLIVAYLSPDNCTLLIDSDTRSPYGFSAGEQQAIDAVAHHRCFKWFGPIMCPSDMRRYRTLPSYAHALATDIFTILAEGVE
jgi:hypothetical protein